MMLARKNGRKGVHGKVTFADCSVDMPGLPKCFEEACLEHGTMLQTRFLEAYLQTCARIACIAQH